MKKFILPQQLFPDESLTTLEEREIPNVLQKDDELVELSQKMSEDGLFVPQSSITIHIVVGEGKNALLVKIVSFFVT